MATETQEPAESLFVVELEETETSAVKAEILEAHKGKTEMELEKEIADALSARLKAKQDEAAPIIAKMEELAKDEANKGKTEDELLALASEALVPKEGEEKDDTDEMIFSGGLGSKSEPAALKGADKGGSEVELPAEVKARLAKMDQVEADPVYKAYLIAKDSKADIDLVDMILDMGFANNPEKINNPLFFKQIEVNQMRQDDPSITDDEIKEFLEDFNSKSKIAQWAEVKGIKEMMVSQYKNAKSLLATKISSGSEASKESAKQMVAEADKELRNYVGQKFYGVEVTEAHRQKVVNAISSGTVIVRGNDGKIDVAKTAEAVLLLEQRNEMFKTYFEMGRKQAERKATLKGSNPLKGVKYRSGEARAAAPDKKAAFEKAKRELRPEWVQ